jgi:preprotein translocase subunit SecD
VLKAFVPSPVSGPFKNLLIRSPSVIVKSRAGLQVIRLLEDIKSLNVFQRSALTLRRQSVTLSHAKFHSVLGSKRKESGMPRIKFVHVLAAIAILAGVLLAGAVGYQFFKAVMSGLGLRGGTYQIVYEIDLSTSLQELAKNKDDSFEAIMREVEKAAATSGADFFETLQEKFAAAESRLNRYFGSPVQTDAKIIAELKTEAAAALDHNIKILHKRLAQYGVHKRSINKEGRYRIALELAGITDIDRAVQILGKTARLEFKLVQDRKLFQEVLIKIDSLLRRDLAKQKGGYLMASDTAAAIGRPEAKEVTVSELFGGFSIVTEDTSGMAFDSVRVYKKIFAASPFLALLRNVHGEVGVPVQNFRAVELILHSPKTQKAIPVDAEFAWSLKPESVADAEYYYFYLLKKAAELTGAFLTDARAMRAGGAGLTRQGEWVVNIELNDEGTHIFSRVTGTNINKRLAIVLDKKVVMAPNIKERIPSGRVSIEGNMNADEAKDLAVLLRAGSLQAPLKVIETRRVR